MNEAGLRIVDKYLHKGWYSYWDMAFGLNDAIVTYEGSIAGQERNH